MSAARQTCPVSKHLPEDMEDVFMRCELCWPLEHNAPNSTQCQDLQRREGCHACGTVGCWRTSRGCPFFNRHREVHPDAGLGDNVPHMVQTRIQILKDDVAVPTGRPLVAMWWLNHRITVRIESVDYYMGRASGSGCNCLIDTLRQCLNLVCNVSYVRQLLEERHRGQNTHIEHMDFLQLDWHWRDVLQLLSQHNLCDRIFDVNDFRVICVDMNLPGHGDVFGRVEARHNLYICRQNLNHFVPLFRLHSSAAPMSSNGTKPVPAYSSSSGPSGISSSASSSLGHSSSSPVVPSAPQPTAPSIDPNISASPCQSAPTSKLLEFLNLDPITLQPMDMSGPTADESEEEKCDSESDSSDHSYVVEVDEISDTEDVFLNIQPSSIADNTPQGQRYLAMRFLEGHLKDEVTMPFQSDFCAMDFDKVLESRT